MEAWLHSHFAEMHIALLAVVIVVSLYVLGKAADWLVDEAVELSERSHIPTTVIGATVVSLGTTTPEAAVSVLAAAQGAPGLALGNAVGSVICDTGLILGVACLISPLRLDRNVVNRQGWIQVIAGFLLVLACWPWAAPATAFTDGGNLARGMGVAFLVALAAYMWQSIRWARQDSASAREAAESHHHEEYDPLWLTLLKLLAAVTIVVLSAQVLIPAVTEAATRLNIPESIIAATLVAFGTSLPELVTSVTAARRGHGELAVGNVVGADILNVLFVSGAAAAATPGGLHAAPHFFRVLFPAMLFVLVVFRVGIWFSGKELRRPFGYVLLGAYALYLVVSYLAPGPDLG
ncbi:MAG: calcium/sodium antiporter [Bryobacterales bacterium]|nr:calcium/sodium antiporter [Bryobacterales bacterium]